MKTLFPIVVLIAALTVFPTMLFAQCEGHHTGKGNPVMSQGGAAQTDSGRDTDAKGKMKRDERWEAEHQKLQDDLKAMDQRLDEKVAAMNSATGDKKIAAMTDAINELAAQRKQMIEMFKTYHIKMRERMKMMRGKGGTHHKGMQGMQGGSAMMGGQGMKSTAPAESGAGGAKQ